MGMWMMVVLIRNLIINNVHGHTTSSENTLKVMIFSNHERAPWNFYSMLKVWMCVMGKYVFVVAYDRFGSSKTIDEVYSTAECICQKLRARFLEVQTYWFLMHMQQKKMNELGAKMQNRQAGVIFDDILILAL